MKLGLIWGSVVHCDVFVLVCCAFCMLGSVHLTFLEVLDTHLVKVQGVGCNTVRGCIVTPPKWTPLPLPHLPILLGPRRIFMFSMSKIGEDMCLSARMPSVDKVEKSQ